MKTKMRPLFVLVGLCAGLMFVNMSGIGGCGGGGGGNAADDEGGGGGAGEASVASLSTVPTLDLSTLDASASSSAALSALGARKSKSAIVQKGKRFGEDLRGEGQSSRAGCEANAHKDEIFRMSQMAQLDRCYPEAMEAAGIITIGDGFSYYSITPPEMGDEAGGMCDDIPDERVDDKAACEEGSAGGPKEIKMRLGLIDGVLQIDMCESDVLQNEATYAADGSVYSATVTRIGNFLGETDGSKFTMTVDLGTTGEVTDGLVTIGDGSASASAQMNSRFGDGLISFDATSSTNAITGAFAGGFTDPFTGVATTFTGKVHTEFGPADGCAKFSFSGSPPPMRVQDMVPFDISADQLDGFLQTLGLELGIELTVDNYQTVNLCPNPAFDPEDFDASVKPMVAAEEDGGCPEVAHTGLECFAISTGATTTDFGSEEISQTFTTIANDASSFYTTVNAFDLSALDPTVGTVAFTRNWDCTGAFTAIAFESMTAAQMALLQPEMEKCFAIQEKAFNREGMGGYNCNQQEQMNGVNDMAQEGPPDFGPYGGEYALVEPINGTCPPDSGLPYKLFANPLNVDTGEYCLPMDGECQSFEVAAGPPPAAAGLSIDIAFGGASITDLLYTQPDPLAPAVSVRVTFSGPGLACNQLYNLQQPTFEAPPDSFEGGGGGGMGPPQACIDLFGEDVTREECEGFCMSPEGRDACAPPPGEMP